MCYFFKLDHIAYYKAKKTHTHARKHARTHAHTQTPTHRVSKIA